MNSQNKKHTGFKQISVPIFVLIFVLVLLVQTISVVSVSLQMKNMLTDISLTNAIEQSKFMAKHAEYILKTSENPIADMQAYVNDIVRNGKIAYAVCIDKNVQAVAHSDSVKLGKIYDDDYTVEGSTKGSIMHSLFYADVQGYWTYDIMYPIYNSNGTQWGSFDTGIPTATISDRVQNIVMRQVVFTCCNFVCCPCKFYFVSICN